MVNMESNENNFGGTNNRSKHASQLCDSNDNNSCSLKIQAIKASENGNGNSNNGQHVGGGWPPRIDHMDLMPASQMEYRQSKETL